MEFFMLKITLSCQNLNLSKKLFFLKIRQKSNYHVRDISLGVLLRINMGLHDRHILGGRKITGAAAHVKVLKKIYWVTPFAPRGCEWGHFYFYILKNTSHANPGVVLMLHRVT